MHNPGRVRHLECVRDLYREVQEVFEADGLALDALLQGCAFQALHDDEQPFLVFTDVVNGADVGMIQGGCGAGFALKTLSRLRILGQLFGKELQGHAAAKTLIFRLVNHAHSAATELLDDAVMGDCLAEHVAVMLGRE